MKDERLAERTISIFAPATVANVGCGFDIFGFCLHDLGDQVNLTVTDKPGVKIKTITGDGGKLPREAHKNTAGVSVAAMLEYLQADFGVEIEVHKKMPISSGLGSSAASAVASVFALNCLLKTTLKREILLKFAIEGEKIASGNIVHLDNIGACLYGGFILARSNNPIDIISIPTPADLICTIVHPNVEIITQEARNLIKKTIALSDAVVQWGNIAATVKALITSDYDLLGRSMTDVVAEPVRAKLIPYFHDLKKLAGQYGAIGCSIAGSGPSLFSFSHNAVAGERIGRAMSDFLKEKNIESEFFVSKINEEGPKIVKDSNTS